jgi:hypothetical protein
MNNGVMYYANTIAHCPEYIVIDGMICVIRTGKRVYMLWRFGQDFGNVSGIGNVLIQK